jgi:hypothetical protein
MSGRTLPGTHGTTSKLGSALAGYPHLDGRTHLEWGMNLGWEYLESAGPQRHGSETTCLAGLSQGPMRLPASWVVHWLATPILMAGPTWSGV